MALTDKLTSIANAIRGKTGGTVQLSLTDMATEITNLSTGGSDLSSMNSVNWTVSDIPHNTSNKTSTHVIDVATNMGNDFTPTTPFFILMPWMPGAYGNTDKGNIQYASIILYDGENLTVNAAPWHPYPNSMIYNFAYSDSLSITNDLETSGIITITKNGNYTGSSTGGSWQDSFFMFWNF